jgi:hypothetical protein
MNGLIYIPQLLRREVVGIWLIGSSHATRGRGLLVAAVLLEAGAYWWQPCYWRLGPTGGSHAIRGWGLLIAVRSLWKHVDSNRLR